MLAIAPELVDMSRAEASPAIATRDAGPPDADGQDLAQLQPLRQLWRSDAGHARKGTRLLLAAMLDDLYEQATSFLAHLPDTASRAKRCGVMKRITPFRAIALAAALVAALAGAFSFLASAQSEFMRGDRMPYDAFERLPKTDIEIPGGIIHVAFAPGDIALPKEKVLDWVRASAKAVATYYGRFPVAELKLLIVPVNGPRVRGGTTWGYRGAAIRVMLGRDSSESDLRRDWVMVHEMVHLALPDLAERHAWLSEGLAVYVEPIARVQAGDLTAAEIWQAMMRDMPKGLPEAGDRGLDNTDTWGRKYWGGAMFCPARRHRNPQGHRQQVRPAGRDARRHRRRRQSRAGLADRARAGDRRQGCRRRRADAPASARWGRSR